MLGHMSANITCPDIYQKWFDISIETGAYELPKEHETPFHDNPNYITMFEI